jgi:hypothetical protein
MPGRGKSGRAVFLSSSIPEILGNFAVVHGFNRGTNKRDIDMGTKIIVTGLAMLAFGFGFALRSNAGTDTVEPYRAPAPTYNYAPPPPRPVFYAPPVTFGVAVGPGYRYWGPRFGWWGPHRFYGRNGYWRFRHPHWH